MAVPASASGPFQTSAPIGRTTSFSARFTDAPLAEGKFETYLHERENAKKPRAVRLSRPQLPMMRPERGPVELRFTDHR
jgi:hypothetical protein